MGRTLYLPHLPSKSVFFMWVNIPFVPWILWDMLPNWNRIFIQRSQLKGNSGPFSGPQKRTQTELMGFIFASFLLLLWFNHRNLSQFPTCLWNPNPYFTKKISMMGSSLEPPIWESDVWFKSRDPEIKSFEEYWNCYLFQPSMYIYIYIYIHTSKSKFAEVSGVYIQNVARGILWRLLHAGILDTRLG